MKKQTTELGKIITEAREKKGIADLIDKLELASIEKKEISNDEILDRLKEIISMIRPNLEKFDKSKYSSFDSALFPKRK